MIFFLISLLSLSFNLSAEEYDSATHLLKKTIAVSQKACKACEQNLEKTRVCPEVLSNVLDYDKQGGMYGLRKSAYEECNKGGHSLSSIFSPLDYTHSSELIRDVKNNLEGIVSAAVLNRINKCASSSNSNGKVYTAKDQRIMVGKAAYSLLRIESAEKELYDQMAFADFVNSDEPLKGIECSDSVFPSMESKCSHLKNDCFKKKDKERGDFFANAKLKFTQLKNMDGIIANKDSLPGYVEDQKKARDLLLAQSPWLGSESFKKIYAKQTSDNHNDYDPQKSIIKYFAENRKSSLKKLNELKDSSACFLTDEKNKSCEDDKIINTIDSTPELALLPLNNFATDQDKLKWNINMDAQSCLTKYSKTNSESTDMANEAIFIGATAALTGGLSLAADAALALNVARSGTALARNANLLARTAFMSQFSLDAYYGVSGVSSAIDICNGNDITKVVSSTSKANAKLSCPLDNSADGISYQDQEGCKLQVIMAVAGGLPVAIGLKKAQAITADMKLKDKLQVAIDHLAETDTGKKIGRGVSAVVDSRASRKIRTTIKDVFGTKPTMIVDRNEKETLAVFGNAPGLKAMFDSKTPLKIGTLGAGKGISAEELANKGHQVTAVEIGGKTETVAKETGVGGSITRINGTDASRAALKPNSFDLFYETHGANAYTDRPDLLTNNILGALKKDGKYYAFGGGDADSWALNNKVILENGDVVSYLDWIKTVPGIKVEVQMIPGKLNEAGEMIGPPGSYFVITKLTNDAKVPDLSNIFREFNPGDKGRMVPHQTFAVKTTQAPQVQLPVTSGATQHFVSQGLPTDQLSNLATKGAGAKITIPAGPTSGGILDRSTIRLKNGDEVTLGDYLKKMPGIKVSYSAPTLAKQYIETRNGVKIFTGNADVVKNNFRVTQQVEMRDAIITVTNPSAVARFCKKHGLDLAGLGKPAPVKFDSAGNAIEEVRAPYYIEK